jgi:hypothetical protein
MAASFAFMAGVILSDPCHRPQEKQAGNDKGKPMPVEIKCQLGRPTKPVVLVPVLVNGKGPRSSLSTRARRRKPSVQEARFRFL